MFLTRTFRVSNTPHIIGPSRPPSLGCRDGSDEDGAQTGREARRPGAHVHQHQQREVHPPGRVHSGRPGRQLLRVPAETVDPRRQEGNPVSNISPCVTGSVFFFFS